MNKERPLERIAVRELRNYASRVVRRARAGERMIVTVDGVPAPLSAQEVLREHRDQR